ncbi:MAG: FtsX-like permease family protein [Bacteroides sp.]|nr:FtsX-like permease family protein [Bacteroides sp.]
MVTLRIALRYLFSKKSHSAVNVISFISMAGVAVATVAIVCVLSVFNGFSDLAESRLSVVDPDVKVVPVSGKVIRNADSLALQLVKLSCVDTAVATVDEQALAIVSHRQMAVNLRGVPDGYTRVSNVTPALIDGVYALQIDSTNMAVLSVGTAIKLAAHPGSMMPFALYAPRRVGRINPTNPMSAFRSDSLGVAGVYEIDEADKDASTVMVSVDVARRLLDFTDEASAIEIKLLSESTSPEQCKADISKVLGPGFKVLDRLEQEEKSFKMIAVEKWITFIMLAFILLIASFNVVSTLSMLMIEKADNMATLRALGARHAMIRRIFIWEGWLISVFGGVIGILTGLGLCLVQQKFGIIKLAGDASQLSLSVYPVRVSGTDLLTVMGLVVLTGLFISVITTHIAPHSAHER